MSPLPVIAIFDVGKTNKKLFLFDEHYQVVYEKTARFKEIVDEDGEPCENLYSLRLSVFDALKEVFALKQFDIKAINFSAYGASLVYVDDQGEAIAPLYNYLKDYPEKLAAQFYGTYGGADQLALETASPSLGSLNSGLQLYRMKYEHPAIFAKLKYALHLPQYLSFLVTNAFYSDVTSIGCHTALWDFKKKGYHSWLEEEGLTPKLAPLFSADTVFLRSSNGNRYVVGTGLHDSSASLIPYELNFSDSFLLLSTGTWNISMNPFNQEPLTLAELKMDCLCYLQYKGKPVKSSRLFLGFEYEEQVKRIADYFEQDLNKYRSIHFDPELYVYLFGDERLGTFCHAGLLNFSGLPLAEFKSDVVAYYYLMRFLVHKQYQATSLVLNDTAIKRIFVTGGFSKNSLFMSMLAQAFPQTEVFAATMPQASAIGAAMAIHKSWNPNPMPNSLMELKYYNS